jgi:tRNA G18 (ribose-2'-O)-methylase SpoU
MSKTIKEGLIALLIQLYFSVKFDMKVVILENIRSAYNVGNVIRTADALGWKVRIVGYTPSPVDNPKVRKTSLGAEESVALQQFDFTSHAIQKAKES